MLSIESITGALSIQKYVKSLAVLDGNSAILNFRNQTCNGVAIATHSYVIIHFYLISSMICSFFRKRYWFIGRKRHYRKTKRHFLAMLAQIFYFFVFRLVPHDRTDIRLISKTSTLTPNRIGMPTLRYPAALSC